MKNPTSFNSFISLAFLQVPSPNTCSDVLKAAFSYSLRSFTCRLPLTNQTWTHLRLFSSVYSTILFPFTINSLTCFWDEANRL